MCVIDVVTKHAWVKPLKDKKGKTVLNSFNEIGSNSNRKPNEWVHQEIEFYNKLTRELLNTNDTLMYSTHNEVKSVTAERFIKT